MLCPFTNIWCFFLQSNLEFCYKARFYELNHRGRGNPWSLRQAGLYQNHDANRRFQLLLLSSSTYIADRASDSLNEISDSSTSITKICDETSCLVPHLYVVMAMSRNWYDLTEHFWQKLAVFVRETQLLTQHLSFEPSPSIHPVSLLVFS